MVCYWPYGHWWWHRASTNATDRTEKETNRSTPECVPRSGNSVISTCFPLIRQKPNVRSFESIHFCGFFFASLFLAQYQRTRKPGEFYHLAFLYLISREKLAIFYHTLNRSNSIRQSLSHGHLGGFSKFHMLSSRFESAYRPPYWGEYILTGGCGR